MFDQNRHFESNWTFRPKSTCSIIYDYNRQFRPFSTTIDILDWIDICHHFRSKLTFSTTFDYNWHVGPLSTTMNISEYFRPKPKRSTVFDWNRYLRPFNFRPQSTFLTIFDQIDFFDFFWTKSTFLIKIDNCDQKLISPMIFDQTRHFRSNLTFPTIAVQIYR